jgi:hypothetical protein
MVQIIQLALNIINSTLTLFVFERSFCPLTDEALVITCATWLFSITLLLLFSNFYLRAYLIGGKKKKHKTEAWQDQRSSSGKSSSEAE